MIRYYVMKRKFGIRVRINLLGHMQQKGSPSPFDRNLGTKLAARALEYLITQAKEALQPDGSINAMSSDIETLLDLKRRRLVFTPVKELEEETEFSVRLPKTQWGLKLRPLLRILAKHSSIYHTEAELKEPILE